MGKVYVGIMRLLIIALAVAVLVLCGCENQYSVITERGIVDMPLSKALERAQNPRELYPLLSDAATLEDRAEIEERIAELEGEENSSPPRNLNQREEYLREASNRRIKYVQNHSLDDKMKKIILSGAVIEGMTKEEFIASRGKPDEIRETELEEGSAEVFIEGLLNEKKYYFIDGKLAYWD